MDVKLNKTCNQEAKLTDLAAYIFFGNFCFYCERTSESIKPLKKYITTLYFICLHCYSL